MIQGTTPRHVFTLPIDSGIIAALNILYSQNGEVLVKKSLDDCEVDGSAVAVVLTQEDTLKFDAGAVRIQLRVLTAGGEALASRVMTVPVDAVLEKAVIA